jgi:hypothetical protein
MRRLLRILFNAFAVLSLVLSVGSGALWVRGKSATGDRLIVDTHASRSTVTAADGDLDVWCVTGPSSSSGWSLRRVSHAESARFIKPVRFMQHRFAGVKWIVYPADAGYREYWARVPLRILTVGFALAAVALWLGGGRQRSGPRSRLCVVCGYDLRATPERCPECGAVPTTQPARPGGAGG